MNKKKKSKIILLLLFTIIHTIIFFENILSMFIYVLVFELAGEGLSPTKLPRLVWCTDVYLHLPMIKYTK